MSVSSMVGDFNIHVCCPDKPLAKDFLNLIDSFNFAQCVSGPTHEQGHTLDLVLSYGLPVLNLEVCDSVFSEHMPVIFDVGFSSAAVRPVASARRCRTFNPSAAGQFSAAFNQLCAPSASISIGTEEISSWFHSSCRTILDSVAPLKTLQPRAKPEFSDATRTARRECRRAERMWKKDRLQVLSQILKDSWRNYQNTVKEAKRYYLSNIIVSKRHDTRALFKTIDSVLNAPQPVCLEASPELCNDFLINKVVSIRALISAPASDPPVPAPCLVEFD